MARASAPPRRRARGGGGARLGPAADSRVGGIGRSARLGRFVQLRDVFGNTSTYGGVSRLARRFPVLRTAPRVEAGAPTAPPEHDGPLAMATAPQTTAPQATARQTTAPPAVATQIAVPEAPAA